MRVEEGPTLKPFSPFTLEASSAFLAQSVGSVDDGQSTTGHAGKIRDCRDSTRSNWAEDESSVIHTRSAGGCQHARHFPRGLPSVKDLVVGGACVFLLC